MINDKRTGQKKEMKKRTHKMRKKKRTEDK